MKNLATDKKVNTEQGRAHGPDEKETRVYIDGEKKVDLAESQSEP